MHARPVLTTLTVLALLLSGCAGGEEPTVEEPAADTAAADPTAADGAEEETTASAGGGGEVTLEAGDIYYAADGERSGEADLTVTAPSGEVAVTLANEGSLPHNVVVEEAGDTMVVEADAGATQTGSVELGPGTYTLYCDIVGHREAGMEATLTVG